MNITISQVMFFMMLIVKELLNSNWTERTLHFLIHLY